MSKPIYKTCMCGFVGTQDDFRRGHNTCRQCEHVARVRHKQTAGHTAYDHGRREDYEDFEDTGELPAEPEPSQTCQYPTHGRNGQGTCPYAAVGEICGLRMCQSHMGECEYVRDHYGEHELRRLLLLEDRYGRPTLGETKRLHNGDLVRERVHA